MRTHVKRLLRKLGAHSQAEAVSIANGIRATFAASTADRPKTSDHRSPGRDRRAAPRVTPS